MAGVCYLTPMIRVCVVCVCDVCIPRDPILYFMRMKREHVVSNNQVAHVNAHILYFVVGGLNMYLEVYTGLHFLTALLLPP